jgi:N-glycosylase/DNA lyase
MNNDKAVNLVSLIAEDYLANKGIFSTTEDLLEFQIPKGIKYCSKEHARFYFYLVFNDHGTKSRSLYIKFKELYRNFRRLFSPHDIVNNFKDNENLLRESFLSNLGLRYPTQAAKSWISNSEMLIDRYNGEPIDLYNSTSNAVELFKRIKNFRSYGPKTSGVLVRIIKGVGFNGNLRNITDVPLPVDIHDSRIALMCGIYKPDGLDDIYNIYSNPKHIQKIEKIWRDAAKKSGVKWVDIDRALWLLGSKGCVNKLCIKCPINQYCKTGRSFSNENGQLNLFNHSTLQH